MKPSFAIVGCGKVGKALGKFLTAAGYRAAGFAGRSLSSAREAADIARSGHCSDAPWEVTRNADIVFITTPDGAIKDTCDSISRNNGFAGNVIVLHCSGALPSTILSAAKVHGAYTGSMHPLQSFASADYDFNPFRGIIVTVEGDNEAVLAAKEIASDLSATAVTLLTEAKTLYHASAVVASNYLVTLLDLAFRLINAAGIAGQDAFNVLKPLIDGTLANIEKVGIPKALTGPIVRGDVETVEKHLKEIGSKNPELLALYKTLGFHTIAIAKAKGTISESAAAQLKKIL
ncbi:MAG: Rossmann-like and DUF2520 domain-containing protein [Pseudomonadota bacterium]|uniref:DUF2520 domain-containing protein n=1 Tax=Candidatus Desulfatibia profunda TaxID=2841695 RepID=A0A8J6NNK5_9BACT|nr:DUF2520 domain-containing protein [Candidatus Desulfatibia profunda]MBL7180052.1 DUF2520 domain-containing protein [Desulfobacterales bacterium]